MIEPLLALKSNEQFCDKPVFESDLFVWKTEVKNRTFVAQYYNRDFPRSTELGLNSVKQFSEPPMTTNQYH